MMLAHFFLVLTVLLRSSQLLADPERRDLSSWDFNNGKLYLGGYWSFYWQQWLFPDDTLPPPELSVQFNRPWNNFQDLKTGLALGAKGFATYVLEIEGLEPRSHGYTINLADVGERLEFSIYPKYEAAKAVTLQASSLRGILHRLFPVSQSFQLSFIPRTREQVWTLMLRVVHEGFGQG
ncbi:MAG: hypothetical protein NTX25_09935, partial [Proteobacteria bacterium]|nr:hypothetical protein [Pseudomonadota bacterium]